MVAVVAIAQCLCSKSPFDQVSLQTTNEAMSSMLSGKDCCACDKT